MIGQFKLTRMTVIWPTSRKREQGKKEGYYRFAPLTITWEIDPTRGSSRSCVMYVYLLRTLSIHISKTKLLVKMASESGCFATLTEEDLLKIIDNKDLWGIVKQIQHGLFREVVKLLVPRCWMRKTTSLRFTSGSNLTHLTPRDQ